MTALPDDRLRVARGAPVRRDGAYVLLWATAARRLAWSFALDRALAHARDLDRPLLVLEALRAGYPHASARHHRFVVDGMAANAARAAEAGVAHLPYVEPEPGAGCGLLAALAARACVVVTDAFPCGFLPRMVAAAARSVDARLEVVDGCGLLPLAAGRAYTTAFSFRAQLQRALPAHLARLPHPDPLADAALPALGDLPGEVRSRWPAASAALLAGEAPLPVDDEVPPVEARGGAAEAEAVLARFLADGLDRYADDSNQPTGGATSGLSPYLHFGHVSPHRVLVALAEREGWTPDDVGAPAGGKRAGWWGTSPAAESFLDQVVTWRELGFQACAHAALPQDTYDSLPEWSRATLEAHAADPREHLYDLAQLEAAETHDELWNAAQRQLRTEGRIHGYLRMLWGKRVLEWTAHPREAFDALVHLNDRWALDGRDPNSYAGIGWVLGRFDRAWGPERAIYGKVRYMSSANTARKLRVGAYLERYGATLFGGSARSSRAARSSSSSTPAE